MPHALIMADGLECETPILGSVGKGVISSGVLSAPEKLGGQLHGFNDFYITCTAADIAAQRVLDLFNRGIKIGVQQGFGRHNHAGRTESALDRP